MSWPISTFGEVATVVTGSTPKKVDGNYGGTIPFVTPGDLGNGSEIETAKVTLTEAGAKSGRLIPKNSVMVCCIGATIGKTGIATRPVATNQQINSLVFDEKKVFPKYGYYFCLTLKSFLLNRSSSTTMPIVNKTSFSEIEIPLPPLEEQKRIASILDKADAIRRKRQQAIQLADEFLRAVFLDMFGDPVTNPKGFPLGTIRDLVESANYGTSAKADPQNGKYPVLRMGNLTYSGSMDYNDLKYIDIDEKDIEKYIVREGDLLFNRTNSRELVGKTAVFDSSEPMVIAGYLIRIRTNELANSHYISAYLNSKHGKSTLLNMCKSIVGMANINAQEVQDIAILRPPIELQEKYKKIAKTVEERVRYFRGSETKMDTLFSSLSQKAFLNEF